MIGLTIVAVGFGGLALSLSRGRNWPGGSVLLPLIASIIVVLYAAALMGGLRPVAWTLVISGWALGIWHVRGLVREGWRATLPPPSVLGFVVSVAVLAWEFRAVAFSGWDEFSHWGLVSKEIVSGHGLITADSPVIFKDYPPGTALFHYFVTLALGFSERAIYLAHAVAAVSGFAAVCSGRRWPAVIATFVFGYFALSTFFWRGFQAVDVDHLVALFFGCGLAAYFVSDDRGRVARLLPVLAALPLLKSVGFMLALFAGLTVLADQLLVPKPRRVSRLILGLLVVVPLVVNASWKAHASATDSRVTFRVPTTPGDIRDAFSAGQSTPRQRQTIAAFRQALTDKFLGTMKLGEAVVELRESAKRFIIPGLTTVGWGVVYGVLVICLASIRCDRHDLARFGVCQLWLGLAVAGYLFGLLVLYLFSFSEYEGTRVAHFPRYVGIIVLGVLTVAFGWALAPQPESAWRRRVGATIAAVMTIGALYTAPSEAIRFFREGPLEIRPDRIQIRQIVRPAIEKLPNRSRVYFIWEGTSGFQFHVARYELAPRRTNTWCWSLGTPRFEGDQWTCRQTVAEWQRVLMDFDHVVLGHVDDRFWQEFGSVFKGATDGTVFDVHRDAGVYLTAR